MKQIAIEDRPPRARFRLWRVRWIQIMARVDKRELDYAVVAASVTLLLVFPIGIFTGLKIGVRQGEIATKRVPSQVELAAYLACTKEFNSKFVSEPLSWQHAAKCNRIARAARAVIEGKKDNRR